MTAQLKTLPAPVLPDAVGNILYVHNLPDPTPGKVEPYPNAKAGDVVKLTVSTSTGNNWQEQHTLTAGEVGKPINFSIKKETFEKGLVPGATADLHYKVSSASGNPVQSLPLTVHLER
ncbi:hypothetical protein V466_16350 [Pseudomonas mandelii PD30]|uniref:Uncharacterized protein n=1 Tax=Pseudomonas mandelii PD30 TaxID=1419583 RepID=A0A059L1S4_9PSED|nr:hypothetical protein [Pseudomonas mandelii]KDD67969.1 hypothetical protein V466_16350 [Pseudomonas mandelii PD30]